MASEKVETVKATAEALSLVDGRIDAQQVADAIKRQVLQQHPEKHKPAK